MVFKLDNLVGLKFKMLTVLERVPPKNKDNKPTWLCLCDCGNKAIVTSGNLKGATKSCGCWVKRFMIIKFCKVCEKEIKIKKSHAKKNGIYCSKFCMAIGYGTAQLGKNNPNYRHGLSRTSDYFKPYAIAYRTKNKDVIANNNRKMRAKRNKALGTHTKDDVKLKLILQWHSCYWCFDYLHKYEIDHIVPLARGGSNCKDNIVPVCVPCNRQKRDSFVSEWYLKPNCRAKRKNYDPGRYSVSWNGNGTSTGHILLDRFECRQVS